MDNNTEIEAAARKITTLREATRRVSRIALTLSLLSADEENADLLPKGEAALSAAEDELEAAYDAVVSDPFHVAARFALEHGGLAASGGYQAYRRRKGKRA